MKNLLKFSIILVFFGSTTAFSQKPTLESPHNYKRPVVQQSKALSESSRVSVPLQDTFKFQNNISSAHNYKRQGIANFVPESAIVINIPSTQPLFLSPFLSANHYKSQFHKTTLGKQTLLHYRNLALFSQNSNPQPSKDAK